MFCLMSSAKIKSSISLTFLVVDITKLQLTITDKQSDGHY